MRREKREGGLEREIGKKREGEDEREREGVKKSGHLLQ